MNISLSKSCVFLTLMAVAVAAPVCVAVAAPVTVVYFHVSVCKSAWFGVCIYAHTCYRVAHTHRMP